jgi:signal transduction histidine kinase
LSRDLHDQLGQQLTALRLALNVLKDAARDDGIRRQVEHIESNLYRIAQESLHNIAKHARAANVSVALEYSSRRVELTIADDGVGFDAGTADARDGMGLVGMRERAALIGGELLVDSARQRGTVVTARVQLASSRAE